MPTIDLSDEELQGFITLCATASGPGINWVLTNALLTKAQAAAPALPKPPVTARKRTQVDGQMVDLLPPEH